MADFKSVSWNAGEAISRDKLTTMANNDDILFDQMPKVRVTYPTQVNSKTKIIAGRFTVSSRKGRTFSQSVSFGSFFTPGCQPLVTASVISDREDEVNLRIHGSGQVKPSATSMVVAGIANTASGKKKNIERSFYVDWIAVGY